ncbi:MAG: T9SS type A sorting domain-containing protein [Calditrichaceae bacterium]
MKFQLKILYLFCLIIITSLSASESPNIGNLQVFPPDNAWNWDISGYEIHPNSDNFIDSIGPNTNLHPDFGAYWQGTPIGIPYIVVDGSQPLIDIEYTAYGNESDPGPFPIPLDAPIEGGPNSSGDRHVIALDTTNAMLYEIYSSYPADDHWEARLGAKYDLTSNALRTEGWTSADAAGLPIFPGLVRYEEVYIKKEINHALRFTVSKTRNEYIYPARHFASSSNNSNYPPMGLRFRLKADFDISGFSEPIQVILTALKKYGMIVADNGSDWYISGAPDDRWDNDILGELKSIDGYNFEAIKTVDEEGNPIFPTTSMIDKKPVYNYEIDITNYPNPFNPKTTILYTVGAHRDVPLRKIDLSIYNILGQKIVTLISKYQTAGTYTIQWNANGLPSGIYLCRLSINERKLKTRKLMLLE